MDFYQYLVAYNSNNQSKCNGNEKWKNKWKISVLKKGKCFNWFVLNTNVNLHQICYATVNTTQNEGIDLT